jgi:beta-galactosidase
VFAGHRARFGIGALFQFRKSRGSAEKFHGASWPRWNSRHARFREVAEVGQRFEKLDEVSGSRAKAEVALIYDWENEWALSGAQGPRNRDRNYRETVERCIALSGSAASAPM